MLEFQVTSWHGGSWPTTERAASGVGLVGDHALHGRWHGPRPVQAYRGRRLKPERGAAVTSTLLISRQSDRVVGSSGNCHGVGSSPEYDIYQAFLNLSGKMDCVVFTIEAMKVLQMCLSVIFLSISTRMLVTLTFPHRCPSQRCRGGGRGNFTRIQGNNSTKTCYGSRLHGGDLFHFLLLPVNSLGNQ